MQCTLNYIAYTSKLYGLIVQSILCHKCEYSVDIPWNGNLFYQSGEVRTASWRLYGVKVEYHSCLYFRPLASAIRSPPFSSTEHYTLQTLYQPSRIYNITPSFMHCSSQENMGGTIHRDSKTY